VISQERLNIEVKLLLSANKKSYMPCWLSQQQMTFSDLKWQFHASRAISVVAELLVYWLITNLLRRKVYVHRPHIKLHISTSGIL